MLAAISGLIGLIIFIAIAIISSLFKRKEEEFELPPELKPRRDKPPPSPPHQQPSPARTWEQELRQLLENRPAPPPIVRAKTPPSPPRIVRAVSSATAESHIQVALPAPRTNVEPAFQTLPGLTQSDARYADAASLQQRVTQHLADVTRHRVGTTVVTRREATAEARDVALALHNRQSVRRAIVAAIVLGPPRALES